MAIPVVSKTMKKVFGTRNDRLVKRYLRIVDNVSKLEPTVCTLTDAELRAKTDEFRQRLKDGATTEELVPEVFAVAREAMDRNVGIRNIFNRDLKFDKSLLPRDAQMLYDEVVQEIDKRDLEPPVGPLLGCTEPVHPWLLVDIPVRLYEAVRELYPQSKPPFRARPFDVQIIGAIVLYEGKIAEMKTGEGKTIVAPLATYLATLEDRQVHVVTVNSYLVQRDRDWTFPFFRALGLTIGAIHPMHMQPLPMKQAAYQCDVVYGTTSEFGFDYLRDNMKLRSEDQVQKRRDLAIVDEVDSTLIDEARTPLIISGAAHQSQPRYDMADKLARHLVEKQKAWNEADERVQTCLVESSTLEGDIRNARDKDRVPEMRQQLDALRARLPELEAERDRHTQYYEVELDKKKANITHEGISEAQREAGVGSFYVGENIDIPHLLENAIRAHTVYQRDRDYVVAPDDRGEMSVVIVDQNTGRKMVGRQWSDGLHQAVESMNGVPIKEETQTMATITIQNFFKLYDRLSGMTGTADTEATEFYEIYKLDVIVIPTNVPVERDDRNDLVFTSVKDKWAAIVDEIKYHTDIGQPVLVGTTSVEKSEELSGMLKRRYNIPHEVLNAKHHEREADIVTNAGQLGAVMIATNMAGRGTDIKLAKFSHTDLIDHWKKRGICPREVNADMSEADIATAIYRHIAPRELDLRKTEVSEMSDDDIRIRLLRAWYDRHVYVGSDPEKLSEEKLLSELDRVGSCKLHRIKLVDNVNAIGGLHVIATERHDSRRIDNQLRGRSGRQGDNGSSRFFLSLEDDLMKMFAGDTTLKILSRLGMKEGDAIEHPLLNRSVGKAQRKVEERNFLMRKNILEYDEIMDVQRHEFYGMRQRILEGKGIKDLIFEFIDESVADSVYRFLDRLYVANCVAEWIREHLNVSIDPDRIRNKLDDRTDLHRLIMVDAKEEAGSMVEITIGEYMSDDTDSSEWDLKALADWANGNFKANLKISELTNMKSREVVKRIEESAAVLIDAADLSPLDQFLVANYGPRELVHWVEQKFDRKIDFEQFIDLEDLEVAVEVVGKTAREAYAEREVTYPADFAIESTSAQLQNNPQQALIQFCAWAKAKYEIDWDPQNLPTNDPRELRELLVAEARTWDEAKISKRVQRATSEARSPEALDQWFQANCRCALTEDEKKQAADDLHATALEKMNWFIRLELTQMERWVLLQIVDQAWKDHLYAMDQTRESIGFRSFSQRDPRIEYKREGARLFEEMHSNVRDKVTDLIFKAKLRASGPQQPAPQQQQQRSTQPKPGAPQGQPADPAAAAVAAAAAAASVGTEAQRRDIDAANRAGQQEPDAEAKRKREAKGTTKTQGVKQNFKRRRK